MSAIDDLTARYRAVLEAIAEVGLDPARASLGTHPGGIDVHVPAGTLTPEPQALAILAVLAPFALVERTDHLDAYRPFSTHEVGGVTIYAELHTPED